MIGDKDERKGIFSAFALVTGLGLTMVAAMGVCGFAGYLADRLLSTAPVFLIVGIVLGVAVGALQAYRSILKTMEK
jgi:F0F1-type ATP synthase assembly protein I